MNFFDFTKLVKYRAGLEIWFINKFLNLNLPISFPF